MVQESEKDKRVALKAWASSLPVDTELGELLIEGAQNLRAERLEEAYHLLTELAEVERGDSNSDNWSSEQKHILSDQIATTIVSGTTMDSPEYYSRAEVSKK